MFCIPSLSLEVGCPLYQCSIRTRTLLVALRESSARVLFGVATSTLLVGCVFDMEGTRCRMLLCVALLLRLLLLLLRHRMAKPISPCKG